MTDQSTDVERIETLLHAAASASAEDRPKFLDDNCRGNPTVRRLLEVLLSTTVAGQTESPVDELSTWTASSGSDQRLANSRRTHVGQGRYVIVRALGHGGQKVVYSLTTRFSNAESS